MVLPCCLLIVPYGIETLIGIISIIPHFFLLIVPYGIETVMIDCETLGLSLLIVPYGIETQSMTASLSALIYF